MTLEREIEDMPIDYLEQTERLIFKEFDEAFRQYHQEGLPVYDKVRAYEQTLEVITAIRKLKENKELKQIEQAQDVLEVLEQIEDNKIEIESI